jgi:hypothetical protein
VTTICTGPDVGAREPRVLAGLRIIVFMRESSPSALQQAGCQPGALSVPAQACSPSGT